MWLSQAISRAQRGNFRKAEAAIKQAREIPVTVARRLFEAGSQLAGAGDLEAAAFLLRQAVNHNPKDAGAWINLGSVCKHRGHLKAAADAYQQAIQHDPTVALAHSNLGSVCVAQGDWDAAERHCREAIRLDPTFIQAHLNLGVTLKRLNCLAEAEASQRTVLRLQPNSSEAYSNLASIALEQKKPREAATLSEQALQLDPQNRSAQQNLAFALVDSGNFEACLPHFEATINGGGDPEKGQVNYGLALRSVGESDPAGRGRIFAQLAQDHVYGDPADAHPLLAELAATLPVPDSHTRAPLHAFVASYEPQRLYDRKFWRRTLKAFGDGQLAHDKVLRAVFSVPFSWSLPVAEVLERIASVVGARTLASYGAGTGYWEYLLAHHFGVTVHASDLVLGHRFIPMESADFKTATVHPDDVVFLSWMVNDDDVTTAAMALLDRMAPGQTLVLVGDRPEASGRARTCGTNAFFAYLATHFQVLEELPLVNFAYIHDGVSIATRR